MILSFDRKLSGYILATETGSGKEAGSVTVAFLAVCWPVDGQKVQRVVRELVPRRWSDELSTGTPSVT